MSSLIDLLKEQEESSEPSRSVTSTTTTTATAPTADTSQPLTLRQRVEAKAAELDQSAKSLAAAYDQTTGQFESSKVTPEVLANLGKLSYYAGQTGDKELRNYVAQNLYMIEQAGVTVDRAAYGLQNVDTSEFSPSLFQRTMNTVLNLPVLGDTLEYLGDLSEGFTMGFALMQADEQNRVDDFFKAVKDGALGREQRQEYVDLVDQDGDGAINFREMLGLDPNTGEIDDASGFWDHLYNYGIGAIDTIGLAITDPTTYLTLGTPTLARAGLEAVEAIGGRGAKQLVARNGLRAMPQEFQDRVMQHMIDGISETYQITGKQSTLRKGAAQFDAIQTPQTVVSVAGSKIPIPVLDQVYNYSRPVFGRRYLGVDDMTTSGLLPPLQGPGIRQVADQFDVPRVPEGTLGRRGIQDIPIGVLEHFAPRASISRILGTRVANLVDDIRVATQGAGDIALEDISSQLVRSGKTAAREWKMKFNTKSLKEAQRQVDLEVREALEGGLRNGTDDATQAAFVAASLRSRDLPLVAKHVEQAVKMRDEITRVSEAAGLQTPMAGYFPRQATAEGTEFFKNNSDAALEFGFVPDGAQRGELRYHEPRSEKFKGRTTSEVNDLLRSHYPEIPDGVNIFEEDVLTAFATRGKSAYQAATLVDMMDGLTRELHEGLPLAIPEQTVASAEAKALRRKGYAPFVTPGGTYWMPREISEEMSNMRGLVLNDEGLKKLNQWMENWSKTWGAWATSPVHKGTGFHMRNHVGNLMLNAAAGIVDFTTYAAAARMQLVLWHAKRKAAKSGRSISDELAAIGSRDAAVLLAARKHQILNGFFDDIIIDDPGWVSKITTENPLMQVSRGLGNAIEDNARLTHFIHQLDNGLSPQQAARSVRTTLFDYGDLTGLERASKRLNRFYTFMRKNTAFQTMALIKHPGRVAQLENRVSNQAEETALGILQPDYSAARGDTIMGLAPGLIASIDTPFGAAAETLRPFLLLPDMLAGRMEAEDVADAWMALVAGGPEALANTLYSAQTGRDPFTKRELDEAGNEYWYRKLADSLIGPAWGAFDSMATRASGGEGFGPFGNQENSYTRAGLGEEAFVLSNILGMNVAVVGNSAVTNFQHALKEETAKMLEDLPNLPTVEQFREHGLWAETATAGQKARSLTLREKILAAMNVGLPTEALEAELAERLAYEEEKGYIIDPDTGEFTTREGRLEDYTAERGLIVPSDAKYVSKATKVVWNQENPDDQFLGADGEPLDEYDLESVWYLVSQNEVLEWAQRVGAPLSDDGNVSMETQAAWNAAFPDNPYYGKWNKKRRAEEGLRPILGVFEYTDANGVTHTVRADRPLSEVLFGN